MPRSWCRTRPSGRWVGYVAHAGEDGTDVFLYAPSLTRDFTVSDDTNLPSPPLRVNLPGAMLSRPQDGPEPSSSQSGAAKACHRPLGGW